jgi:NADPH-dependent F420 reductase
MQLRVGIVGGTGPAGRALAARLASVGVDVVVGSRSEEKAATVCDDIHSKWPTHDLALAAATNEKATAGDIVVLATKWDAAVPTAESLAGELAGKVVVSMANALTKGENGFEAVTPPLGSIAAEVAQVAPEALVAAAFQHLPARSLGAIDKPIRGDVLICSDQNGAIEATANLVRMVPGLRPLNGGPLSSAAPVEAFTAVLLGVNERYKARATVTLTGIPD